LTDNLNLWTITDGSQGMISQVNGLAQFMNNKFIEKKIKLKWPWSILQPGFIPFNKKIFEKNFFEDSLPNMIISCGRKSVYASIYLKKQLRNKIINIHIQNPKISIDKFDFIVAPDHDGLQGSNVYTSKGAIHYLTIEEINESRNYLENKIEKNKDVVSLILGGPTKYYNYADENMINIFSKINKNLINKNLQLIVIQSNRTPKKTTNLAKEYFNKSRIVVDNVDKKAYLSSLALSKYVVVTCDSISMISEAALTGKPIYVAMIPALKNDKRFKRFRNLFEKLNIIRNLDQEFEIWNYEKLDETNRIASEIKKKIS